MGEGGITHVDCKLTLEPVSEDAIDTDQDEKNVEQPRHRDAIKRLERARKSSLPRQVLESRERSVWSGLATGRTVDRSPRSEVTFIRTGIEGCLRRSWIGKRGYGG